MGVEIMILDYEQKILIVKIVYYGPAMSGKTTSIRALFTHFGREMTLDSIESSVGRTLFFDFGVLQFKGAEWSLKFLIYSATGQDFYASTRPATLNGVDGIIFIGDGRLNAYNRNIQSWNELLEMFREEIYSVPIVISLNKYDLKEIEKINEAEFLQRISFENYEKLSINRTSELEGIGVLQAFNEMIRFLFPHLKIDVAVKVR